MKAQIMKPESGKTHNSEEYKQQALELWQSSGRSAAKVGTELGIRPALIFRWEKAERDRKTGHRGHANDHPTPPASAWADRTLGPQRAVRQWPPIARSSTDTGCSLP